MALSYAGIPFVYPTTQMNVAGNERDPSNSDQILTIIHLSVRSIINYQLPPAQPSDLSAEGVLSRVRHLLTSPRQPLYYDLSSIPGATGGKPIINLPDGRDDAGGPWPDPDAFSAAYTTQGTIEVVWKCTVKIRDCGASTTSQPLSLRWQDSISWDETWKATYRRAGTLIISSRSTQTVDWFRRNKIAPTVCSGFRRANAHYECSRDGLRCDFQFTDEQIRWAPPYPGIDMRLIQSESGPLIGGMRNGEVSVSIKGIQNANVVDLARWAQVIGKARVWAASPQTTNTGTVIGNSVLRTDETPAGVDVSFITRYKVPPNQARESTLRASSAFWGGVGTGLAGSLGGIAGIFLSATQPVPPATQQGQNPAPGQPFGWLGVGTSPQSPTNPTGYAQWANPAGAVGGPADGVGLATSVGLFAQLLGDPCGRQVDTTPFATGQITELRTSVKDYNSPTSGQGGKSGIGTSQLSASLSNLNASQYPVTNVGLENTGLYFWDGQPAVYDYWQCLNEYLKDPGVIVIPTCNPNGINIKVRHSSQMITLRKRWAASRVGAPPAVPPENMDDPNWVLTFSSPQIREIKLNTDGVSYCYEIYGVYEYQALDPSKVVEIAEVPPFLALAPAKGPSQWFSGFAQLVGNPNFPGSTVAPAGGSGLPGILGGGGGGSVLGSGILPILVPN